MFCKTTEFLIFYLIALAKTDDPISMQLELFKEANPEPVGILTTSAGAPVGVSDFNTLTSNLIEDDFFMDSLTHLVRERIPERPVHAVGTGAFGYFEVTNDITSICKAKLFERVGKKTPVVVRFSTSLKSRGASETAREGRGFAVKFYTEEGNLDILSLNTPIFNIFDPIWFLPLTHSLRVNPVTNLEDFTMFWDFLVKRPESLFAAIIVNSDLGIPDGYRHMPGFSIHTFQVVNKLNQPFFMRFHFIPDAGIKNLNSSEAERLSGAEPSYATKDLYNAIASGDFPSWSVKVQILTLNEAKTSKLNPFDITKILPETDFPLQPLGRIVLNRNPDNFFANIEQLTFCPSNLVPGILGAPDKIFEARSLAYREAHNYRLGINHDKIPVNCPYRSQVFTYNRDGVSPVDDNEGGTPNYVPNSFSGPKFGPNESQLLYLRRDFTSNLYQVAKFYNSLSRLERESLWEVTGDSLCNVPDFLVDRVLVLLSKVSIELQVKVAEVYNSC